MSDRPHVQRRSNSWFWRRSMAYIMMVFCMTTVTWITQLGAQEGTVNKMTVEACFWLMGAIFLVYVASATTDDLISLARILRGQAESRVAGDASNSARI